MAERVFFNATGKDGGPVFEQAQKLSEVQIAPSGEGEPPGLKNGHQPPQN